MKSFPSLAAQSLYRPGFMAIIGLATVLLFSQAASAQQPATGRKKAPALTTDEVVAPRTQTSDGATQTAKPDAAKTQAGDGKTSPEELAWRERVRDARERAKSLERAADEAELRVTELRNALGTSGQGPKFRNETAAALEQAGRQLLEIRAQARAAKADLETLLAYGKEKGFTEAAESKPTTEGGKPNEQYYRERYGKLVEELQTAERRAQLYDNRVRDLNQRIQGNSRTGDNFYIMQIQQDRDEAAQKLSEAHAARDAARKAIEDLKEDARRAGLPPGIFR
jgi:chromosome segregation ATPase